MNFAFLVMFPLAWPSRWRGTGQREPGSNGGGMCTGGGKREGGRWDTQGGGGGVSGEIGN